MYKVIVFAGTTEGYEVSRFLAEHRVPVFVSVATEYGKKSLTESEYLTVQAARLDQSGMEKWFCEIKPELILDATHPYAAEVTMNIRAAAENAGCEYQRVLRASDQKTGNESRSVSQKAAGEAPCDSSRGYHGEEHVIYVESTEAAAEFLTHTEGNVLLTTGSKELAKYTCVPDFQKRLFARVLSLPSVMISCSELGFEGRNLIGMQGPFSKEINAAMLQQYDCKYLVTKDTGKAGGFQEKLEAAEECGVTTIIIGRPLEEEGISVKECKAMLANRFGFSYRTQVTLLGIGMGSEATLTLEGKRAVEEADLIIGAKRMADAVALPGQSVLYEYRSEQIASYIEAHPEFEHVIVALSGDVGFYSGARKLLERLGEETHVICGISSVVYFMSKIGLSWDDAKIVSAHGRACNLISLIQNNEKVFAILGTSDGAAVLAQKLTAYGMGDVLLYIGENLSYPNEKIFMKKASELTAYEGDALSVVCAVNEDAEKPIVTHGLSDEVFIRGKAPMTKEEVRAVSLAKLRLQEDSICYDVGAGTGSVSIEMARMASQGKVYAIEKKEDTVLLLHENKKKFVADNLEIIEGLAPDAMENLPAPTHAFIGGSSGNLKEICQMLLNKNPKVRIVINCITLETVAEALDVIRNFGFENTDIVQMSVSRSKSVGRYHMMMGENPIYVITCQKEAVNE